MRLEYTYEDGGQYICPECAHEWNETESAADLAAQVLDANGAALQNGDTVILIKDLKVKGSSMVIKQGTKVKGIRLQEGDHNIGCKIDGSAMNLKSEFVKKPDRPKTRNAVRTRLARFGRRFLYGGFIRPAALAPKAAFFHAGQDEEIAAAEGADVFFQRFAVEEVLHEDESVGKVCLIADEHQSDIKLSA